MCSNVVHKFVAPNCVLVHHTMNSKPPTSELQTAGSKIASLQNTPRIVLLLTFSLVLLTIIPLYLFPLLATSLASTSSDLSSPPSASSSSSRSSAIRLVGKRYPSSRCDIFRGEWVPNPSAPYYTNESCWAIHNHQNCMKFGRPDNEFMKWKWKPNDCDLPVFNPGQFLELVRGKSLAFVGDSVGRNQMQSLICFLLRVTYSVDASPTKDDRFKRYHFPTHNFTIASFWSPFLVRSEEANANGPTRTGLFNLYLDEPDTNWTTQLSGFDYVIISAGHWFLRPSMFYESRNFVGCHYCLDPNVTDLTMHYSYRRAFRLAFRVLNDLAEAGNFRGLVFLRTFAPSHFENGEWNKGGNCVRQRPFRSNETRLDGYSLEMYMTQLEEYAEATRAGRAQFRLLDTTDATLLRPDGHPSRYGHRAEENVTLYNDCVHWCLPGPIDTWNDFLLQMLKNEGGRGAAAGRRSWGLRKSTIK